MKLSIPEPKLNSEGWRGAGGMGGIGWESVSRKRG